MVKGLITIRVVMIIFFISLILGFIYQNYLEFINESDSIGIAYTLYGSIIYATMLSIFSVVVYCAYKLVLKRYKKVN
jgi:hypothetical protein